MRVVSINGATVESDSKIPEPRLFNAELVGFDDKPLRTRVVLGPIVEGPMRWSLWSLSAVFAALGAVVVVRRPDHAAARLLGLFGGFTAVALAVSPSASGVHTAWALVVMFVSLIGVGATLLPFSLALLNVDKSQGVARVVWGYAGIGAVIVGAYAASVALLPEFYPVPRTALALYVATSVLGAVLVLAVSGAKNRSTYTRQQARLVLFGVLLGTSPFVVLTLLPGTLGSTMLLPAHLTVLPTGLVPACAVVAIMQFQLFEIRRLVHRGMVYALTTTVALFAIVALASFATPLIRTVTAPDARFLFGASLVLGIAAFYPLRACVRWFVDRFIYKDTLDPQALIDVIRKDVATSPRSDTVATWLERIAAALRLESVVLFARTIPGKPPVALLAGTRAREVCDSIWPQYEMRVRCEEGNDPVEFRWRAESLLFVPLSVGGQSVGHLILGPKEAGEVMLPTEQRIVALVAPVLALALHKGELSEQLRVLNRRLVEAEEAERARLAADLHDGPLQKAILLGGGVARAQIDHDEVARELTLELREVCSRLRPAILDDLGLAAALEWLLEQAAGRFGVRPSFALHGVDELARFPIGTELALFRIAQEAMNNAVKHGKATALDVSLTKRGETLILTVEDDGVGFSAGAGSSRGLGIPGMHGRALHAGGSVDIRSTPGVGTSIEIRVPCGLRAAIASEQP